MHFASASLLTSTFLFFLSLSLFFFDFQISPVTWHSLCHLHLHCLHCTLSRALWHVLSPHDISYADVVLLHSHATGTCLMVRYGSHRTLKLLLLVCEVSSRVEWERQDAHTWKKRKACERPRERERQSSAFTCTSTRFLSSPLNECWCFSTVYLSLHCCSVKGAFHFLVLSPFVFACKKVFTF